MSCSCSLGATPCSDRQHGASVQLVILQYMSVDTCSLRCFYTAGSCMMLCWCHPATTSCTRPCCLRWQLAPCRSAASWSPCAASFTTRHAADVVQLVNCSALAPALHSIVACTADLCMTTGAEVGRKGGRAPKHRSVRIHHQLRMAVVAGHPLACVVTLQTRGKAANHSCTSFDWLC